MTLVINKCAEILKCRVSELRDRLNHPIDRAQVMAVLMGRAVRTTYTDRNGFKKSFIFGGLTLQGADALMAFGRLARPFCSCVAAYYYSRYRIKLHNPYHVCAIEKFPPGAEDRYFPLELLELIDEPGPSLPSWMGRSMFGELSTIKEDEEKEDDYNLNESEMDEIRTSTGREECSQDDNDRMCYW